MTASSRRAAISTPADDQILITRDFDAPAALAYRAWTEPELVRQWWFGRRGEVTTCEIDLRVGGGYRYVMIANGGFEVAFHGEYRELVPGERIVHTEVYEAEPGAPALVTVTFEEHAGVTTVSQLMTVADKATRDAVLESGMEGGVQEQGELLDALFSSLT